MTLLQTHFKKIDENCIKFLSMAIMISTNEAKALDSKRHWYDEKKWDVLRTYLESNKGIDMQVSALFGIQQIDVQLEHPKGGCRLKHQVVNLFTK